MNFKLIYGKFISSSKKKKIFTIYIIFSLIISVGMAIGDNSNEKNYNLAISYIEKEDFKNAKIILGKLNSDKSKKLFKEIEEKENEKNYNLAISYIEKEDLKNAKNILEKLDIDKSKKLLKEINNVTDLEIQMIALKRMSDEDFIKLKNNSNLNFNIFSINKLDEVFIKNISKIENLEETRNYLKKMALLEKEKEEEEKLKKQIATLFSGWDGSNIMATRIIKEAMNDPKSYEHIETKYVFNKKKKTITVRQEFRGRNGFGGMVRNVCVGEQDIATGMFLSIEIL